MAGPSTPEPKTVSDIVLIENKTSITFVLLNVKNTFNPVVMKLSFLISVAVLFFNLTLNAQNTVGLSLNQAESHSDGYIVMGPIAVNQAYLIDRCGYMTKRWSSNFNPGLTTILAPDGNLLRLGYVQNNFINAGGIGGVIEKLDWNGNVLWNYQISDSTQSIHHDILGLENGNVLVFAWTVIPDTVAIAQGRNPERITPSLYSEKIMEIQPIGTDSGMVVWEWKVWDHLVQSYDNTKPNFGPIAANPQLIDLNYKSSSTDPDWIHFNSIDYNPTLDQILVSCLNFNEIWIIDHSTTIAEAAGHTGGNSGKGGDLLYRWGNPQSYNVDSATHLFGQHDAHWIKDGLPFANQIMVFNNGNGRTGGNYSTVEIINPPVIGFGYDTTLPYLPTSPSWIYNDNNQYNFYVAAVSSAQMLPSGNVLVTNGLQGTIFEIDSIGNKVWSYINPVSRFGIVNQGTTPNQNQLFTTTYYPTDFPGFIGKTFDAPALIENSNSLAESCSGLVNINQLPSNLLGYKLFPNPSTSHFQLQLDGNPATLEIDLVDYQGKTILQQAYQNPNNLVQIDLSDFPKGLYLARIKLNQMEFFQKLVLE